MLARLVSRGVVCEQRATGEDRQVLARCLDPTRMDIAERMVVIGAAFAFRPHSDDYVFEESDARGAQRGLWRTTVAMPWDHRAALRQGGEAETVDRTTRPPPIVVPVPRIPARCASYQGTCEELGSCRAARFAFEQCGRDDLDADNDTIPCESLCLWDDWLGLY